MCMSRACCITLSVWNCGIFVRRYSCLLMYMYVWDKLSSDVLYSLCYHIAFLKLFHWHSFSQINLPICAIPQRVEDDSPRTGIVSLLSFHEWVGCFTSFLSHLQWLGMAAGKEQTNEHSKGAKARTVWVHAFAPMRCIVKNILYLNGGSRRIVDFKLFSFLLIVFMTIIIMRQSYDIFTIRQRKEEKKLNNSTYCTEGGWTHEP